MGSDCEARGELVFAAAFLRRGFFFSSSPQCRLPFARLALTSRGTRRRLCGWRSSAWRRRRPRTRRAGPLKSVSNFSPERRTPSLNNGNAFGKEMCLLLGATFPTMMVCVSRQPFVAGDGGKARDDGGGEGGPSRGAREGQSREGGFAGGGEEVPAFRAGE